MHRTWRLAPVAALGLLLAGDPPVLAVVAVNEMAGPVLLEVALDRAGETAAGAAAPAEGHGGSA